jgi:hypothetical protein
MALLTTETKSSHLQATNNPSSYPMALLNYSLSATVHKDKDLTLASADTQPACSTLPRVKQSTFMWVAKTASTAEESAHPDETAAAHPISDGATTPSKTE